MSSFFKNSNLRAVFNGKTFTIYEGEDVIASFPADSGANIPVMDVIPDSEDVMPNEVFMNNPKWTDIENLGSIPEGEYTIGGIQENTTPKNNWDRLENWIRTSKFEGERSSWGNYRMPITSKQKMGRGGFFVHGGDIPGSAGCIDLSAGMDNLIDFLRQKNYNGNLDLTVRYE